MLITSTAISEAYHETKVARQAFMEAKVAYEEAVKVYRRVYREEQLRLYPEEPKCTQ